MKVFIAGDHRTGTGPANVTKEYINNFPKEHKIKYQKMVSKLMRVPEMVIKTAWCDVILFSGYSRQNLLGIRLAGFFGKKTAYLMHGCVEYENEINGVPDEQMNACERATMQGVDIVYAVSERFCKWLKGKYPEYAGKMDFIVNGVINPNKKKAAASEIIPDNGKNPKMIFSIGGGMPRKMIKYICSAIKLLNEENLNLKLVVAGDKGLDTDAINAYPFVENVGLVNSERIKELFSEASLFVQNSCFETFGLAPVESLSNGCSVLLSDAVGALDIINGTTENDIIYSYNEPKEIAEKIKYLLSNPNGDRLLSGIDFDKYSWENRGIELCRKLQTLLKK